MNDSDAAPEGATIHGTPKPLRPRWVVVSLAVFAAIAIATPVWFGHAMEQRRLETIANAEDKYSATYLSRSRDGEGGGIWRLSDGVEISCRLSGSVDDPVLRCGKWSDEPVVTSR